MEAKRRLGPTSPLNELLGTPNFRFGNQEWANNLIVSGRGYPYNIRFDSPYTANSGEFIETLSMPDSTLTDDDINSQLEYDFIPMFENASVVANRTEDEIPYIEIGIPSVSQATEWTGNLEIRLGADVMYTFSNITISVEP